MHKIRISNGGLELVTLGGYGKLKDANLIYQTVYEEYRQNREHLDVLQSSMTERVLELGNIVATSMKTAKRARRMLRRSRDADQQIETSVASLTTGAQALPGMVKIDRVFEDYSASVAAVGGGALGTASAAAAWSLVGLVGTASTGTAITTLSGAAATNATLAWLGGGALAAGGAGIFGGTLVIGGIVLAPVIAIAAVVSRSKLKKIEQETINVRHENGSVLEATANVRNTLKIVESRVVSLKPLADNLMYQFELAKSDLYPVRAWSLLKRCLGICFGRSFYVPNELTILEGLEKALSAIINCVAQHHTNLVGSVHARKVTCAPET